MIQIQDAGKAYSTEVNGTYEVVLKTNVEKLSVQLMTWHNETQDIDVGSATCADAAKQKILAIRKWVETRNQQQHEGGEIGGEGGKSASGKVRSDPGGENEGNEGGGGKVVSEEEGGEEIEPRAI